MKNRDLPGHSQSYLRVSDVDATVAECAGNDIPGCLFRALEVDVFHLPFTEERHFKNFLFKPLQTSTQLFMYILL